jgi:hypothetical protein
LRATQGSIANRSFALSRCKQFVDAPKIFPRFGSQIGVRLVPDVQANGGKKKYGGITNMNHMIENLQSHSLPETLLEGEIPDYDAFLEQRRRMMALKIKQWFEML